MFQWFTSRPARVLQLLGVFTMIGCVLPSFRRLPPTLDGSGMAKRLLTYAGESISWKPCGPEEEPNLFECSSVEVPLDQFNGSNHARACADTMGGVATYINSPQTVADMNTILDALGQKDMYYWGFSYGTLLGQTYATLFPERSKRVVIDGVLNQFLWYNSLIKNENAVDQNSVYSGLLEECIKAGPERCALASHASTKAELAQKLFSMAQKLRDDPIAVYINNGLYGIIGHTSVWFNGILSSLYRPASWQLLAKNLAALLDGNATDAFLSYEWRGEDSWLREENSAILVYFNDALFGPQHWPQDHRLLLDKLSPKLNKSLFSDGNFNLNFVRAAWAIPKSHAYVPRHGVKTAHPLLVLSTTYDPICPLISAKNASATFEGARLVEIKGYGHCSFAVPSVCAARHVQAFFANGKLPAERHVQCEVDGNPYFGDVRNTDGNTAALVQFHDPWDQRVHAAQVELAKEPLLRPLPIKPRV